MKKPANLSDKINIFLSVIGTDQTVSAADVSNKLRKKGYNYSKRHVAYFLANVLFRKHLDRIKIRSRPATRIYVYFFRKPL